MIKDYTITEAGYKTCCVTTFKDLTYGKDSKIEGWGVRELMQFVFTVGDVTQPDK